MSVEEYAIGLVRPHRWASVEVQTARLKADGCQAIYDAKELKREGLVRIICAGRVVKLLYAFLLADPRKRKMIEDFRGVLAAIEKRGGVVKDVSTGLDTADKSKWIGLMAVVKDQIRRHQQGKRSALNGTKNPPGRQLVHFTQAQYKEAKAIWRDPIEYPTWASAKSALESITTEKGEKFTTIRAVRKWGKRPKAPRKG
jgi:hypothetical protein